MPKRVETSSSSTDAGLSATVLGARSWRCMRRSRADGGARIHQSTCTEGAETVLVGNRWKGPRRPKAHFLMRLLGHSKVHGDFSPGCIECISGRIQGFGAERCPVDHMASLYLDRFARRTLPRQLRNGG